jgi:flagellar biogenesis protein FliO
MPLTADTPGTLMNHLVRVALLLTAALSVTPFGESQNTHAQEANDQNPTATIIRPRGNTSGQVITNREATSLGSNGKTAVDFPTLPPRTSESRETSAAEETSGITSTAITVASSLLIVLGLFAGLVWFSRKVNAKSNVRTSAVASLIEPLGSHIFDHKTQMHVIRFSNRILLVAQANGEMKTLCEIDDPAEVQTILNTFDWDPNNEFAKAAKQFEPPENE